MQNYHKQRFVLYTAASNINSFKIHVNKAFNSKSGKNMPNTLVIFYKTHGVCTFFW